MLHPLCGRPLVGWPIAAALEAGADRVVVVDSPANTLEGQLPDGVTSRRPAGARRHRRRRPCRRRGDRRRATPSSSCPATSRSSPPRRSSGSCGRTPSTAPPPRWPRWCSTTRPATAASCATTTATSSASSRRRPPATRPPSSSRSARSTARSSPSTAARCSRARARSRPDNAQGELYLPDVLPALRAAGHTVGRTSSTTRSSRSASTTASSSPRSARSPSSASTTPTAAPASTIVDPGSTLIDVGVTIGEDTVDRAQQLPARRDAIGRGCTVGPLTTLIDATLHDEVTIPHSYVVGAEIESDATVGPFAYLRPGTVLRERAKAGTFVEIKNSDVGRGSKVPHLSYIGDADIGEGTNLGAATITANYDGVAKHRTTIGDRVHTGVDTTLVAPVTLGDDAYTAANSAITKNVPPGALGVARERQTNIEGYADRKRRNKP